MTTTETPAPTPQSFAVDPAGPIEGSTGTYTKVIGDLSGVYQDSQAYRTYVDTHGASTVAYRVFDQKYGSTPGALTVGTSILEPGKVGKEYALTRGHLHAQADRAEMYHCLSGHGVMLLETLGGQSQAVELTAGRAVNIPGHWIHRSVNVGDQPFVTLFCYNTDAGQDYTVIEKAGGMKNLVTVTDDGGWQLTPNPSHRGYQPQSEP